MTSLADVKVSLVDSVSEAQRFLSWLGERRPVLAVDTETTGLEWWTPGFLRLVQFGDGQQGWAIPVDEWRGVVRQALDLVHEDARPTVFQNIKFDLHALASDGLTLPRLGEAHDTKVMHSLHDPLSAHGLKFLAKKHFGPEAVVGESMLKSDFTTHGWTWATVPTNHPTYWAYGALDTVLTARLFDIYRPLTDSEAYDREMAVQAVLYRAEAKGMRVDTTYTSTLRDTWMAEAEALLHVLKDAGISNPRSNAQVSAALREAGWEPEEFTETGLPQLDKAVLASLEERFPGVASPLLRYRRLIKWSSTYLDTFLRNQDSQGRVHANINTLAARTGRMSVTNPPLQTLPRGPEIRNCIIPSDGHRLWTVDYDSMEMVMLAEFCRDQNLMDAVSEEDIHRYCASLSYGVPVDGVTPAQRQIAKNTNFARVYGAGPKKIATTAGVEEHEIRHYMTSFDARFPGVSRFIKGVEHTGKVRDASEGQPWVRTVGGRRIPSESDKIYALVNYLIQGSCADLVKDAILRLDAVGLGDNILVPVHDEIVAEFHEDDVDGPTTMREAMEDLTSYCVPFTCGLDGPLQSWGAKYDD